MAAESLTAFDWNSIGVLIGTAAGTAAAVFFGYKATKAKPSPTTSNDVVLPAAAIIDMAPVKGMEKALVEIALCMGHIRTDMQRWREDDEDRRERADIASEAYRAGKRHYEDERRQAEEGRRAQSTGGRRKPSPV